MSASVKDMSLAYVKCMLVVTARVGVYYSTDVQATVAIPSHLDATKVCNIRGQLAHMSVDREIVTADAVKTLYDAIHLEHSVSVSLLVRNSSKLSNLRYRLHKTRTAICTAHDIRAPTEL
ncbi:hypothetical protein SDRG_17441 [Saprolegnia diclina VS20]|uniref:Uncharacterized protein n=1 Tax=Saprolegnia diclina (strain VS20) TaxID=1156394 RepID=T0PR35_SAPDV|nr:hypothetical protein SDRG_17441 [Saprolegnia diclina VS20]EQC24666.1 hypothetical protein SDRG_17441 [Saprolegnia diclina VS20]|eukprot:XP_008621905.1 hypothetical protein SDRG_17441 [Saprolegnia diclina VS20]